QLQTLSTDIFDLDRSIRNLPGSTEARQRLVSAALKYLHGLATDSHGNLDLLEGVGEGYARVGRVQGVPTELNLGQPAEAEISLKRADEYLDQVLAGRPNSRRALLRAASVGNDRMILAQTEHRNDAAVAFAHKAANRLGALVRLGNLQI